MAQITKKVMTAAVFTYLCVSYSAFAANSDEEYIRETARITGDSIEVVRSYQKKCESGVTYDMADCTEYFSNAVDEELNNLYQQLRRKYTKGSVSEKKLIEAQRAWVAFRDANCEYESEDVSGGTLAGSM